MSGPRPIRSPSSAEHDIVVTVVRGRTELATQAFATGAHRQLSVGSRGDWTISGPGILPHHVYLRFDGERLFASAAGPGVCVREQPLTESWHALEDSAELRFGFGLLRVSRQARHAAHLGVPRTRSKRLAWTLAVAGALISSLALGGYITNKQSQTRAKKPPAAPIVASASVENVSPVPSALPPQKLAVDAAPEPAPLLKPRAAYPQNVANRPVPRLGDKPWIVSSEWRAHHERQLRAGSRKNAQLIFLGDSITEGWGIAPAYRDYFARYSPFNLGIAGDTTQNVLWRVEHGALDGTAPKVVVVMIGVNNLGGGFSAEDTADGVRATVAAVRSRLPAARVVLLGILPARQDPESPLRQRIRETNRLLESLVEPPYVEYHDLGSVLLDTDGRISPLMTRDFLHPTLEGFKQLSGALQPLLQPLFEPGAQ